MNRDGHLVGYWYPTPQKTILIFLFLAVEIYKSKICDFLA